MRKLKRLKNITHHKKDDAENFLDCKLKHDIEFTPLGRIACFFSHTLQLVVTKFDKATQLLQMKGI